MDRREALRRTAFLMGGALSAPAVMAVLKGCTATPTLNWKPVFLSEDQGQLITHVVDILIPKTDTPGAVDVGVPGFIDVLVKDVYSKKDQDEFFNDLKAFEDGAVAAYGDPFIELTPEQRLEYVTKVHAESIDAYHKLPTPPMGGDKEKPFFLKVKELTLLGFFTSEVGATQVLQYEQVPGAYNACVPLSEVGKTWATS